MVDAPLARRHRPARARRRAAGPRVHDLREFTDDRHRTRGRRAVRRRPGDGDEGGAVLPRGRAACCRAGAGRGTRWCCSRRAAAASTSATAQRYSRLDAPGAAVRPLRRASTSACAEAIATEEVSLGDFVLTGGEVAALAVIEATMRLAPRRAGRRRARRRRTRSRTALLDYPHYTRPAQVRGRGVPEVLLSGDHGRIRRWRRKGGAARARARRPDLLAGGAADGRGPCAPARDRRRREASWRERAQEAGTEGR